MEDERSLTTVDDTVLDLVAKARTDAYAWISRAIGRRLTSPQSLSKALARRSRIRWRAWITAALRDAAEIASVLRRRGWKGTLRPCRPSCRAAGPNAANAANAVG